MQLPLQTFAEVLEALRGPKIAGAGAEKRQATRFEVQTKVLAARFQGNVVQTAYTALTRDISYRGIGLLQSVGMSRGEEFVIRLPRPATRPPLVIVCTVMFAGVLADGLTGIGAQFNTMATDEQVAALDPAQQERMRIANSVLA
jgi:hypothetical protein